LRDIFGKQADTKEASDLLAGILPDPDALDTTTEAANEIIEYLCGTGHPEVDINITAEDIRSGYKAWNKYTSTSPSGLHLDHAKTLVKCPDAPPPENPDETPQPSLADRLFAMEAVKANIALGHGYVYNRWKKVVSAMLEKIPNLPRIDKLRIIHLFEADLNLLLGIIWGRRLMRHGEHILGEEQWGGRAGRSVEEVVMLKKFTYTLEHQISEHSIIA